MNVPTHLAFAAIGLVCAASVNAEGCAPSAENCTQSATIDVPMEGTVVRNNAATYDNDFDFDLLFLNVFSGKRLSEDRSKYAVDVMSMPLLHGTVRSDSPTETGVEETKVFSDVPVFRLASVTMDDTTVADGRFLELPFVHAVRTRLVDGDRRVSIGKLTALTLFDRRASPAEGLRWEALRNPLLRLVAGSKSESGQRFSLVAPRSEPEPDETDIALLDMYSEEDFSTTRFLTLPFVDLFRADADPTATRIHLVDSKLFSLLRTEAEDDGRQTTTVLRLPMWSHLFQASGDGDEGTSASILRLPVLGSVFRQSSEKDGGSMKVLFVPVY